MLKDVKKKDKDTSGKTLSKHRGLAKVILAELEQGKALAEIRRDLLRKGYGEVIIRSSVEDLLRRGLVSTC